MPNAKAFAARLVFGAGSLHRLASPAHRQRLLHQAYDLGFHSFDVAPVYGNGLNELELGLAFAGSRDVRVTTKFGIPVDLYGARHRILFPIVRVTKKFLVKGYGREFQRRELSGNAMVESLHGSLRRLRRDHVERLLIHEPLLVLQDSVMDELLDAAARLKTEGKIVSFGVCGQDSSKRVKLEEARIDVAQTPIDEALELGETTRIRRVAFGVFRHFRKAPADGNHSFASHVDALLRAHQGLDVILATTSRQRLSSLAPLFS